MEAMKTRSGFSAARVLAVVFGVLSGLGGITHGVGEIRQGNVAPGGVVFNSWAQGPIATFLGGEPAMTVVPNLLATGVLTVVVSLAVILWALAFVQKRHGGLILLVLAAALLLVGGGFAPPVVGLLAGLAGLGIGAPHTWWRSHLPATVRRTLAGLWPWVFGASAINGVFLVLGSVILVYAFELNSPELFVYSFLLAVVSLLCGIVTGIAYDVQHANRGDGAPA